MDIAISFSEDQFERGLKCIQNTVLDGRLTHSIITPNTILLSGGPDDLGKACFILGRMDIAIREIRDIKPTFFLEANVYVKRGPESFSYDASFDLQGGATSAGRGKELGKYIGSLMDSDDNLQYLLETAFFSSDPGKNLLELITKALKFWSPAACTEQWLAKPVYESLQSLIKSKI